jgi:ubiquinone/menaquinone biosynthesis C-methylase UbiE
MSGGELKRLRELLFMDDHVCPWWLAYTFDNPIRRILHPPEKVLGGLLHQGCTALDIGCGMGHFTLGMAKMVGDHGRVIALDIQDQMLERVRRRAFHQGLTARIILHKGYVECLEMKGQVDFALAFWVVHEVPDQQSFFNAVKGLLKPDGRFLVAEPRIHTSQAGLERSLKIAAQAGLTLCANPAISMSRTALLIHKGE